MRAVVQRVSKASVESGGRTCGSIDRGLLVYLGVDPADSERDVHYLADKVRHLRVFTDQSGKLNLDVQQAGGHVLVVSAFTIQADARKGRRPSFDAAAPAEQATLLYERFCDALTALGVETARGSFGDYMDVQAVNAGPICILLDSRRVF